MPPLSLLALPQELLQEVIADLWNDEKALVSSSLTHRTITPISQKQLFLRISIEEQPELEFLSNSGIAHVVTDASRSRNGKAFERLLGIAPHLAAYVRALEISVRGDSVGRILDPIHGLREYEKSVTEGIIDPITSLLPSLVNLDALTIVSRGNWRAFTERYVSLLKPILRHPSLLCLQLRCTHVLSYMEFVGPSLRYLNLEEAGPIQANSNLLHVDLIAKALPFIYLDSLSLHSHRDVSIIEHHVVKNPANQIKISQLKNLSVSLSFESNPPRNLSSWKILQACADSLQELEFDLPVEFVTEASPFDVQKGPIDIAQLPQLRKLNFSSQISGCYHPLNKRRDYFCCINKLLWNSSAPLVNLEEINIYLRSSTFSQQRQMDEEAWKEVARFLMTKRLIPALKRLNIYVPAIVFDPGIISESPATLDLRAAGLPVRVLDIAAHKWDNIYSPVNPRWLSLPKGFLQGMTERSI